MRRRGDRRSGDQVDGGETYRNHVPPRGPVNPEGVKRFEMDPLSPSAVNDERLIERASKEQSRQPKCAQGVSQAEWPVAHEMPWVRRVDAMQREQSKRGQRAEGRGKRDDSDACADGLRGISRAGRRRSRGG